MLHSFLAGIPGAALGINPSALIGSGRTDVQPVCDAGYQADCSA